MGKSDSGFLSRDEGLYEQIHTTLFSHVQCCPFPHVVVNAWGVAVSHIARRIYIIYIVRRTCIFT